MPDVQAESELSAFLQDLTSRITKIEDYAVARGGFGEIWQCMYSTDQGPIKVSLQGFVTYMKLTIPKVAVKALLLYASDQVDGAMDKKSKVSARMKVY